MRRRLARFMDRLLPASCWVDWWEWGERDRGDRTLRDIVSGNQFCKVEPYVGSCWCGKKTEAPRG